MKRLKPSGILKPDTPGKVIIIVKQTTPPDQQRWTKNVLVRCNFKTIL
jgi:hypothetical protein